MSKLNLVIVAFFAITAIIAVFPHWQTTNTYQLVGSGDFLSPVNIPAEVVKHFSVYDGQSFGGLDTSYLVAHIVPFYSFYVLLSFFNLNPLTNTWLFISLILFVSQLSMFVWLCHILIHLRKNKTHSQNADYLVSLFGGVLYGFSPYIIGILSPGHFLQLISYALFPLIMMELDLFIRKPSFAIARNLFLLFFFCATSFANVGIIYVFAMVMGSYVLLAAVFESLPLIRSLLLFISAMVLLLCSNAWWIVSYIVSLKNTILLNDASNAINLSVDVAVIHSTITNIFMGRAENLLYMVPSFHGYTDVFMTLSFLFLITVSLIALYYLRHIPIVRVFVGIFLLGVFITKGTQPPFRDLFIYAYLHIFGFQIFRRPVSKFYWVFFFAFITLFSFGLRFIAESKTRKKFHFDSMFILFCSGVGVYWILSFAISSVLTPFSVPRYYLEAKQYLSDHHARRLLILPALSGIPPEYSNVANGFFGIDFTDYIWNFANVTPDRTNFSPDLPAKAVSNRFMDHLRNGESFCTESKQLGITQILVHRDITNTFEMEDQPSMIIQWLDNNPLVTEKHEFNYFDGKQGITLYEITNACRGSLVMTTDGNNLPYTMVNPFFIAVTVTKGTNEVVLSNNESPIWKAYQLNQNQYPQSWLMESLFGFLPQHGKLLVREISPGHFGNIWKLSSTSGDSTVIFWYSNQIYLIVGSLIALAILGLLSFLSMKNKNHES